MCVSWALRILGTGRARERPKWGLMALVCYKVNGVIGCDKGHAGGYEVRCLWDIFRCWRRGL